MAVPTFLVIGAAKAGTTSLHHYLAAHPEIEMSRKKETDFFAGPAARETGLGTARPMRLAEYERMFERCAHVRGESSPSYADFPRHSGVPERIKSLIPDARLVYLVRDPVERAMSHYRHRVANGVEGRPMEVALRSADSFSPYLSPGRYATQLGLYLRCFPARQILVVDHYRPEAERLRELTNVPFSTWCV